MSKVSYYKIQLINIVEYLNVGQAILICVKSFEE